MTHAFARELQWVSNGPCVVVTLHSKGRPHMRMVRVGAYRRQVNFSYAMSSHLSHAVIPLFRPAMFGPRSSSTHRTIGGGFSVLSPAAHRLDVGYKYHHIFNANLDAPIRNARIMFFVGVSSTDNF